MRSSALFAADILVGLCLAGWATVGAPADVTVVHLTAQSTELQAGSPASPSNHRALSIDVGADQSGDYTAAFEMALHAGMSEIGLTFYWNGIETAPGVYNNSNFATANAYYPAYGMPVRFMISPIQTNSKVVPADLASLPFNDPLVIQRFNAMLDWVATQIPAVNVAAIILGNEYDVYLGSDAIAWQQYTEFYAATSAHARMLWPATRIEAESTLYGAIGSNASRNLALNACSDALSVSYYPLNGNFTVKPPSIVATEIAQLCALYPMTIDFEEAGYPSGSLCNSSLDLQAQFIQAMFATWDAHPNQIRMVDFTWMHDLSPTAVNLIALIYNIHSPRFKDYIGSLGLRTFDGQDKPAWTTIVTEAAARDF